ncbi:TPA: hypothetical protein HA318_04860 [Candidatus Micrarchaeota archaeon]|nr:MAG: hypothetical protein AUJ65_00370 [Candidatus Micrarchaeota archaeon CG1_02_51_15]HII39302.1 hypothetical protein [Candidatus Micrarchaeota archaeon]
MRVKNFVEENKFWIVLAAIVCLAVAAGFLNQETAKQAHAVPASQQGSSLNSSLLSPFVSSASAGAITESDLALDNPEEPSWGTEINLPSEPTE